MNRKLGVLGLGCVLLSLISISSASPQRAVPAVDKKRLIVLTDIEADPDDSQSLVRLMLYSNEIDIEGLVAVTSTFQRDRVAPETIRKIVTAYGKVRNNLILHDPSYPPVEQLLNVIKSGKAVYGMKAVGEGMDSGGSELIVSALEKNDQRPLWISIWGGENTLAQALWKIRSSTTPAESAKLYSKLRVYAISDQDDSGQWIRKNFPQVFFIVSPAIVSRATGMPTWLGFSGTFPGSDNDVVSDQWLAHNIQQGHGPLGVQYPDTAYGMEGDTPSYIGLIPNGLNDLEHPNWGGWGGRYEYYTPKPPASGENPFGNAVPNSGGEPETHPFWTNADDTYVPSRLQRQVFGAKTDPVEYKGNTVTIWRWRVDYQNDFAARMLWTTKPYNEANHPPVPVLNMPDRITVKSGDIFKLDAEGTWDPDGDSLSYAWFQYPEAGTYKSVVPCGGAKGNGRLSPVLYNVHTIVAPEVDSPKTAHFILRVTDKGNPPLSRYKRVIVTFVPKNETHGANPSQ